MTANLIDVEYVHIESYRSRLKKSIPILDIQKSSVVRGLAIYVKCVRVLQMEIGSYV